MNLTLTTVFGILIIQPPNVLADLFYEYDGCDSILHLAHKMHTDVVEAFPEWVDFLAKDTYREEKLISDLESLNGLTGCILKRRSECSELTSRLLDVVENNG